MYPCIQERILCPAEGIEVPTVLLPATFRGMMWTVLPYCRVTCIEHTQVDCFCTRMFHLIIGADIWLNTCKEDFGVAPVMFALNAAGSDSCTEIRETQEGLDPFGKYGAGNRFLVFLDKSQAPAGSRSAASPLGKCDTVSSWAGQGGTREWAWTPSLGGMRCRHIARNTPALKEAACHARIERHLRAPLCRIVLLSISLQDRWKTLTSSLTQLSRRWPYFLTRYPLWGAVPAL